MTIQSGKTNRRKTKSIVIVEDDRFRDKLHFDLNKLGHEVELFDTDVSIREFDELADFCFIDAQVLQHWDRTYSSGERSSLTFISVWDFEIGSLWETMSVEFQGLTLGRSYRVEELILTLHHAVNIQKIIANQRPNDYSLERRLKTEIVGQSDATIQIRKQICEAIANDETVLLSAEPGTRQQEVARLMHIANLDATGSFIGFDCRSRPTNELLDLLEESLPEWEENRRSREFDTVYIDHIEHLSERQKTRVSELFGRLSQSVKLVLGSTEMHSLPHREKSFVVSLTESLTATTIEFTPLRKRVEDIRQEAAHYIEQVSIRAGVSIPRFTKEALKALEAYRWPGNSRELFSVCEQICSLISDGQITEEMVLPWLADTPQNESSTVSFTLREMEKRLIEATFHRYGGNREQTAGALKIGIRTLCGKLREYGYPPRGGPGSNRTETQKAA